MALTYGFFNSVDGDRVYSADQMSEIFDGLISNGVYQGVEHEMRVIAVSGEGLNVAVSPGRARIKSKWAKLDSFYNLTLNPSHVTLNRYTAICLRIDYANRTIEIIARDGADATTPTKPTTQRTIYYYELILAYVYVAAGATSIKQSDIEDTRSNTWLCGIVSSLIQHLDTETLFEQYNAAYAEQLEKMNEWFQQQQDAFNTWFNDLTETLNVDTYISTATANYTTESTSGERYIDIPEELNYSTDDTLLVFINGINLAAGVDYTIQANEVTGGYMTVLPKTVAAGNVFTFTIIKSQIGVRS